MLGAGMAWLVVTVVADLGALAASRSVAGLEGRVARLVPAVVAGFALQTLTGALTYLLPVVFGRGAYGNRGSAGSSTWAGQWFAAVNTGCCSWSRGRRRRPSAGGWSAWGWPASYPLAVALVAATRRG